jgi:hypothetical protein
VSRPRTDAASSDATDNLQLAVDGYTVTCTKQGVARKRTGSLANPDTLVRSSGAFLRCWTSPGGRRSGIAHGPMKAHGHAADMCLIPGRTTRHPSILNGPSRDLIFIRMRHVE